MTTQTKLSISEYLSSPSSTEAKRLQSQHHLVVNAFGGMLLCPVNLTKPNFCALDSCGADGFWLSELREELAQPDSAMLIGTDIASYPQNGFTKNIDIRQQNMMDPYPDEWTASFDLIHQRAAVAFFPDWTKALEVTRRQIALLKPGAWIQLVDSVMLAGEVSPTDPPSARFFKTLGNCMAALKLNTHIGIQLGKLLQEAGGVEQVETKAVMVRLGKGAGSPELEELGYEELDKMIRLVAGAVGRIEGLKFSKEELHALLEGGREEAKTVGVDMKWYAAWARKSL